MIKIRIERSPHTLRQHVTWFLGDMKRDFKKFLKRVEYHINGGYECECCGAKIPIHFSELRGFVNGKRMMMSVHSDKIFCKTCLREKIEIYFQTQDECGNSDEDVYIADDCIINGTPCFFYPEITRTVKTISNFGDNKLADELGLDIRFGSGWWNGHYASLRAFQEFLMDDKTKYSTSFVKIEKCGAFYVDRNGIKYDTRKAAKV